MFDPLTPAQRAALYTANFRAQAASNRLVSHLSLSWGTLHPVIARETLALLIARDVRQQVTRLILQGALISTERH